MKKVIRNVDKKQGIVQITTVDERWYLKGDDAVPSVTWIASFYPKGVAYYKWLANKGWDEAESLKNDAGDKGSKVHYAIEDLIAGKEIRMDDKYVNPTTEELEELKLEEYECLMSFVDWFKDTNPEVLKSEVTGFKDGEFAGTIDLICRINGELWIIDLKTSQYIWPSHEIQLSAYKNLQVPDMDISNAKLAILQLGYRLNKKKYKFTEIKDQYDLFLAAKLIWQKEAGSQVPPQRDYPETLILAPGNKPDIVKRAENEVKEVANV